MLTEKYSINIQHISRNRDIQQTFPFTYFILKKSSDSTILPNISPNICCMGQICRVFSGISLVIRQNGESQNECFKKTNHAKFSENKHSYPLIRKRMCRALFFWNTHFEIRPFALLRGYDMQHWVVRNKNMDRDWVRVQTVFKYKLIFLRPFFLLSICAKFGKTRNQYTNHS